MHMNRKGQPTNMRKQHGATKKRQTKAQEERGWMTARPFRHYDKNIRRMLVELTEKVDELHYYLIEQDYEGRYVPRKDIVATLMEWIEANEEATPDQTEEDKLLYRSRCEK